MSARKVDGPLMGRLATTGAVPECRCGYRRYYPSKCRCPRAVPLKEPK
jgi:hypothetical protein